VDTEARDADGELGRLFPGDSEMARRMRALDWSETDLGSPWSWPESLRTAVSICLTSRFPIVLWWGASLTMLYNDGYISVLGPGKHPQWLGRSGRECWSEIWDTIGPMLDGVMREGRATWSEELLLHLNRHLPREEAYFTFSYSPILTSDASRVGGIFCAVTETTEYVIGRRRLGTLRELGRRTAQVDTAQAACARAIDVLADNPADVPCAALYLVDAAKSEATLCASIRFDASLPSRVALDGKVENDWPIARVWRTRTTEAIPLPRAPSPDAATTALGLPVVAPGVDKLGAVLVVGVNPRRVLDATHRAFFESIASHIGTAVAESYAYESERTRAEMLAELDRAKTTFFSNVSHEFRTPLTLMLGPVEEALEAEDLPPAHRQSLEAAHRNGLRLLRLVNTLLDFSRIEAGRTDVTFEPVDVAQLTEDLASVFRAAVERAGLRLDIRCERPHSPVFLDRDMWEKVVLNLLSNAFKFTLDGGITVSLTEQDGQIRLAVRDTGVGIPHHELPHVFERFHRVRGTEGRTHEGTGIGLALVSELVKLHGGGVTVESEVGEGSTFTVSIPTGSAHLPNDRIGAKRTRASTAIGAAPFVEEALRWLPDTTLPAAKTVTGAVSTTGARVLVVDDNADMRAYLVRLLSAHWTVEAAADGAQALAAAQRRAPDLILSDVMMPRLDGAGLVRAVRADPALRAIPVILLSARAGEEARVEGVQSGADDYLTKPFSAVELVARVNSHLALAAARREAEASVRHRELLFRTLVTASSQSVWHYRPGTGTPITQIDEANAAWWREFTGQTEDERTDRDGAGWLDAVHPDERDLVWRTWREIVTAGAPTDVEFRVRRRDGAWRRLRLRGMPVAGEDGVTEHVGTVTDITEQREAEEALRESENRFRGFVTASTDAVFRANADWTELRVLTGRFAGDAPEAVDAWFARFVHPDDRARVAETIAHAIRTKSAFELEYRIVRDGVTAWTFSRALPVLDDRGEIVGWFGAASDVTRRRQAEDAREALLAAAESARAEAERANRAKDEFLATVSHELRSPLQGILGWLALLKRGQLAAEQTTRAIDAVERSVRLQAQLVHDIMDVSRIVAGRVELERAPVDLTALLGQTADEFMPAAVAKRIRLDLSIADCAVVVGDRERLHQVFSNLVANALKFTPSGGRVVLSCECHGDAVVVTVRDTGEGIAPEFLPRLFDRFTQADTSITRRHGGLGLGLAIVRHLVDLHGGTVTAESAGRGKGATFRVHLPVALTEVDEVSPHAHGPAAALPRLDGVDILLVEDDRDALDAMTHALRWTGARVRAATSAQEAWAAFAGSAPDVVVSDLSMPGEDGYSLLRRIKTAARSVPAIALTGFTRAEDKARVLKAGFAAYVAKPIDPDELARVVAMVVGERR